MGDGVRTRVKDPFDSFLSAVFSTSVFAVYWSNCGVECGAWGGAVSCLFFLCLPRRVYGVVGVGLLLVDFVLTTGTLKTITRIDGACFMDGPKALVSVVARSRTGDVARLALANGVGTRSFERLHSRFPGLGMLSVSGTSVGVCAKGTNACPGKGLYICVPGFVPACTFSGVMSKIAGNGTALRGVVLSRGVGGVRSTTFGKYRGLGVYRVQGGATPGLLPRTLTSDVATVFIPLNDDSRCHCGGE